MNTAMYIYIYDMYISTSSYAARRQEYVYAERDTFVLAEQQKHRLFCFWFSVCATTVSSGFTNAWEDLHV